MFNADPRRSGRSLRGTGPCPLMRRVVKQAAETLLIRVGATGAALRRHRGRTIVLAYHNVIPHGGAPVGDRSLHLPQASFAAQLDALTATHDVIPLAEICAAPLSGRPRAVLTFDDAYRGALTAGVTELEQRGLPATIFVITGLFGATTWWDRLAEAGGGAVPPTLRQRALRDHLGRGDLVLSALGPGVGALPPWAQIASQDEVLAAGARAGITLGAHTWSHANLAALETDDLTAELVRPLSWLRDTVRHAVPWLAYPYGLRSSAVERAAASAGYEGAFRIEGGWMPAVAGTQTSRHALPRLNVPSGLSMNGFRLRIAGVL